MLTFFFVVWTTKLQCGFQGWFFSDLGLDMAPDAMSGCVQNIINAMVFVRFIVLRKLKFLVSRGWIWASFWEAFGNHGITFPRF